MHFDLSKLSDSMQKDNRLEKLCQRFIDSHKLIPHFGVEIEFYLSKQLNHLELANLIGLEVKLEKGNGQFEIDLPPTSNLLEYTRIIATTKHKILQTAKLLGGYADFGAKPSPIDYGNSMHFHVNFSGAANDKMLNEIAAKSLCHFMLDSCLIFLPEEDCYKRLDKNFMAPTHISYGNNNRTTAVRIPDSQPQRLEYRLPTPAADPYLAMLAILQAIIIGLESPNLIVSPPKIYGNAFEEQYNLQPLPTSRDQAASLFKPSFLAI